MSFFLQLEDFFPRFLVSILLYYYLELDDFQIEAFKHIEQNESVFISAPTGAGKTLTVDYAIEHVFKSFKRLIYTSPIKALSNQKFRDIQLY